MPGRLIAAALVCALTAGPAVADELAVDDSADDAPAGNQELGARLGLGIGGRVSPGGLMIAGNYLYRLSDLDWFDGGVGFSFGSGAADCFHDRGDDLVCDHGALDGVAADVYAGIRRFFPGRGQFTPYAHGGVALRVASFAGDEVRGVVAPLWIGGGVRARVHETVSVGGGAMLLVGAGWFNRGLGIEPQASLAISAGVEFVID
jgi:hypothetical protein